MYKCKECKTVYKDKVDYCECGNNVFEEIEDIPQSVEETPQEILPGGCVEPAPVRTQLMTPAQILSYAIFGFCCIFSLVFVMFLGPKPQESPQVSEQKTNVVKRDIPQIDKIWNDTPAYTVHANVSIDIYKDNLKDVLSQNFKLAKFDGEGSCQIEFKVDSAGRLKDKKLIRNSANKPLENSAKKMLSNVSMVNPPPLSYDGSTFRLVFVEHNNEYFLEYLN